MTSAERAKELLYRMSAEAWIPDDTHVDWERRVSQAIDAAVAEALPRWVPVTERLPEMGKPVLVAVGVHMDLDETEIAELRRTDTGIAYWRTSYGYTLNVSYDIIKAWQPLPAPWVAL